MKPGMVVHRCNPSTQAEAGRINTKIWATYVVRLHSEVKASQGYILRLSQKDKTATIINT